MAKRREKLTDAEALARWRAFAKRATKVVWGHKKTDGQVTITPLEGKKYIGDLAGIVEGNSAWDATTEETR